jgi:hypothetical protein
MTKKSHGKNEDFSKVPEEERRACLAYELSRYIHSWKSEVTTLRNSKEAIGPPREQSVIINHVLEDVALPPHTLEHIIEILAGIESYPETPWQKLGLKIRETLSKNPIEIPDFHQNIEGHAENLKEKGQYLNHRMTNIGPYKVSNVVFRIDWSWKKGHANKLFLKWFEDNRPKGHPELQQPKLKDIDVMLRRLGVWKLSVVYEMSLQEIIDYTTRIQSYPIRGNVSELSEDKHAIEEAIKLFESHGHLIAVLSD